jgi:hypothetical protein
MQFRSIKYPILSIYELLRSITFLRLGAVEGGVFLPVTWYAGIPLLCLVPFMFIMLASDEDKFASWLPIASLAKALGAASLAVYITATMPDAIRFAGTGDLTWLKSIFAAVLFGIVDIIVGIYCFRRNRTLCK